MHSAPSQSLKPIQTQRALAGQRLAMGAVLALLCLTFVYLVVQDYRATLARERDALQTHARVVDENLGQQLQGINAALVNIRDDADALLRSGRAPELSARLRAMSDAMPAVRTMLVIDADGTVVAGSRPELSDSNLSGRSYFQKARSRPDQDALYVSEPFTTSLNEFSIVLVKAWFSQSGQFSGIVSATLDLAHFEVLLRSVIYAPGVQSALVHGGGRVFLRVQDARLAATHLGGAAVPAYFSEHLTSGKVEGVFGGPPGTDDMLAYRTTQAPELHMDALLVTHISRPVAKILATWIRTTAVEAVLFFAIVVTALGSLMIVRRKERDLDGLRLAREVAARDQSKRLQTALDGGDLGMWELDLASGKRTVDARAQKMVGLPADSPAESSQTWANRIHPDDLGAWGASREIHLSGQSEALIADYRVRHQDGHWVWLHSRGKVAERDNMGRPLQIAGTYLDITERKSADARVAHSEQLLARMSRVSRTGGWDHDLGTGLNRWSDEMFRICELDPSVEPTQDRMMEFYVAESRAQWMAARQAAIHHQVPWDMELQMVTANGNQIWVRSQGEAIVEHGVTVALTGTLKNVTWRKQSQIDLQVANEKLERMALSDGLTGIANRRLFDQTLQVEWIRSARSKAPLSLLMVDIDHFKLYNDCYGHAGGDDCLRQVAALLANCSRRAGDLVSRFGGEEFAILLPSTDMASAAVVAQAGVEAVVSARMAHGASPSGPWVTVSVGVACLQAHANQPAQWLIERADAALYRAKRLGRGRFECSAEGAEVGPETG